VSRPPRRITRRLLVGARLAAGAGAATGVGVYAASYQTNRGQLTFTDPLPIPPLLAPTAPASTS